MVNGHHERLDSHGRMKTTVQIHETSFQLKKGKTQLKTSKTRLENVFDDSWSQFTDQTCAMVNPSARKSVSREGVAFGIKAIPTHGSCVDTRCSSSPAVVSLKLESENQKRRRFRPATERRHWGPALTTPGTGTEALRSCSHNTNSGIHLSFQQAPKSTTIATREFSERMVCATCSFSFLAYSRSLQQ